MAALPLLVKIASDRSSMLQTSAFFGPNIECQPNTGSLGTRENEFVITETSQFVAQ